MFINISVTVKVPNSINQQLHHRLLEKERESNKSLLLHLDASRKAIFMHHYREVLALKQPTTVQEG